MKKLIITCALTGSGPSKERFPALPVTIDEIIEDAVRCGQAGASIVHIHARDKDGVNCHDQSVFQAIYDGIKARSPELIVQLSTGGRKGESADQRSTALLCNPEMASFCTGTVNFPTGIYENGPAMVEQFAQMFHERNIKPELEIFDTHMVAKALELRDRGLLHDPLYFNLILGVKNAQPPTVGQLAYLLSMLPSNAEWSISGIGPHQINTVMLGIALGGHVRVGLEDNQYLRKGVPATNEALVQRVVRLADEAGRQIATPEEARAILHI